MKAFDISNIEPTKYLFFTGKGGVGKTSIACAIAGSINEKYRVLNATVNNKKDRIHNKIVNNNLLFFIVFTCKLIIHYLQKNMNSIVHIFLHYIFTSHNIFYISK